MSYTICKIEYVNNGIGWEQTSLVEPEADTVADKAEAQRWADARGAAEGRAYRAYDDAYAMPLECGESCLGQSRIVWIW